MRVALPRYLRMRFVHEREVPPVRRVPYAVYVEPLRERTPPAGTAACSVP
jgi:hypothetical protein